MLQQELRYFEQLKEQIESTYQQAHPSCRRPMKQWSGQEIVNFQEHLQATVNGRVSEKWFYTHIKSSTSNRLPRVDVLNLLAKYAGHENWQGYVANVELTSAVVSQSSSFFSSYKRPLAFGLLALAICITIYVVSLPKSTYTACFVDATTGEPILDPATTIFLIEEKESPRKIVCDEQGCIKIRQGDIISFVVSAPYYHTDTIHRRKIGGGMKEEIPLRKDDYALMIHYYSTNNIEDWEKRRNQLKEIFADHAKIFQVSPQNMKGMELYNKTEFINKLTTPLRSLGQIEVLEAKYDQDKIVSMYFVQQSEE